MLNFLKNYLKHNSLFMNYFNDRSVKKYVRIFDVPDFTLSKLGPNHYQLDFTPIFGYAKKSYSPEFWYDSKLAYWQVKIGPIKLTSLTNPVFPLINELRGYTLLSNLKSGDQIIDVGAGDGFITSYFSKIVSKKGRVLALEPDPSAKSGYIPPNTTILPACLSYSTGSATLSLSDFGGSHLGDSGVTVPTFSLSDLIHKFGYSKVNFIKLDVEGAEVELVNDLLDLVSRKPLLVVVIASYHKVKGQESWHLLERHAKKYPAVLAKTLYPYHATTYLVNLKNNPAVAKLKKLPAYKTIYSSVWPDGEV